MPKVTPEEFSKIVGNGNQGVRLNIGCGQGRVDGYLGCDISPGPNVDYQFDATKRWPFEDGSVQDIYCSHTLEHMSDHMGFFKEAWRVLKPFGQILIRVPWGHSTAALSDMTHLRPWYHSSFASLQPGYSDCAKGNHYQDQSFPFWVTDTMVIVDPAMFKLCKYPFGTKLVWWCLHHLNNVGREVWATLQKTYDQAMPDDASAPRAVCVPISIGCWSHELEGKPAKAGTISTLCKIGIKTTP